MLNRRTKERAQIALPMTAAFTSSGEWPCVALNLSAAGACVAFAPGTHVPQYFELRVSEKAKPQTVRVVWRRGHTVGVGFMKERPSPDVYRG
ncbi:PilZ domain-containing protein [Methylobacterium komagatae]|uniref:PilZ domain-containing protein n=1 Tax=Methylobacterium komagatae TaxID=374425 RepID=A0ABW2BNC2_9HYPH